MSTVLYVSFHYIYTPHHHIGSFGFHEFRWVATLYHLLYYMSMYHIC